MKNQIKKWMNSRIFSFVKVLVFIAVCAVIGIVAGYIHHESDPTEVAVNYFKAFMKQDYNAIRKVIDVPEDSFIEDKVLGQIIVEQKKDLNVDKYEIKEPKKENGKQLVVIECSNEETGKKTNFKIYLNTYRKGFQLKPTYKVDMEKYFLSDCEVTIPKGDVLKLNDTIIDKELCQTKGKTQEVYHFARILKGEYSVSVENKYGIYSQKISLSKSGEKKNLSNISYQAQKSYKEKVEEQFQGMLQQYFSAIRKKDGKQKDYLQYFQKKCKKDAVKEVHRIVQKIYGDREQEKYDFSGMEISNLKTNVTYNKKKYCFEVVCTYKVSYECKTKTSLINSYTEGFSGKYEGKMNLSIPTKDSKYQIQKITIKNKKKK